MRVPANPKIYHIVHIDKLMAIADDGFLFSDAELAGRPDIGTVIGMNKIKNRRMTELKLSSHPDLFVGQCVPFYFCPRSVMLYLINCKSGEITYKGGQAPIVHLVADLHTVVRWAQNNGQRWAFSLSNAGSYYFEDRSNLEDLHEINWSAVSANQWSDKLIKEGKQAEFLIEQRFPWHLVEEIAVIDQLTSNHVIRAIAGAAHKPGVQVRRTWYY